MNTIRPLYRAATGAEPFIIMLSTALIQRNIANEVYKGLDGIYNHACAFSDNGEPITTAQSAVLIERIFNNDLSAVQSLRNWDDKPLIYFPRTMPQFNEDRLDRPNPRYVLAAAPTEAQGLADVTTMFRQVKRYAPTVSITMGDGDCDVIVNKWVTLSTFNEWPEGFTIEQSVVRGRMYEGSTADPRNARCDYGHDFLDVIRRLYSDQIVTMARSEFEAKERVPIPSIP